MSEICPCKEPTDTYSLFCLSPNVCVKSSGSRHDTIGADVSWMSLLQSSESEFHTFIRINSGFPFRLAVRLFLFHTFMRISPGFPFGLIEKLQKYLDVLSRHCKYLHEKEETEMDEKFLSERNKRDTFLNGELSNRTCIKEEGVLSILPLFKGMERSGSLCHRKKHSLTQHDECISRQHSDCRHLGRNILCVAKPVHISATRLGSRQGDVQDYYIWNVSYIASIIILTVIAMEIYIVIMHPLRGNHSLTNQRLAIVQCVMWSIDLLYNIPYITLYDTISFRDSEFCYASPRSTYYLKWLSLVNVIVWYFLPLVLIGFLYYKVARVLSPHTSNDLSNRNSRSYCRQSSPKLEVDHKQSFRSSSDGPEETMELKFLGRIGDSKLKGTTYQKRQQALRRRSVFKSHRVTRERRKVIRLLIAVVVSFAICVLLHNLKVIDHYWMIFSLSNDVMLVFHLCLLSYISIILF
ncbi:TRISR-like protein [Mya arenaria]|uniref:TRISR-like protein n=1 Tax=Mya arenaria TaxID=6604 RepID=A0ABY7FUT5_MYAAR|nr:TRISR-like protein [Mya arenaria]